MYVSAEEKDVLKYIEYMLNCFKTQNIEIDNAKYHHNTSYKTTPLVLKNGILSISDLNKLGIKKYSKKILNTMSDTSSHVNGIDAISLSVVGLKDLYRDEFEYDPFNPNQVDLLISSDISAHRDSTHYGNEYLSYSSIPNNKIKSVDVRIIELIKSAKCIQDIQNIIEKYNNLTNIALTLKDLNLNIPLRDMSKENLTMDIDKVSMAPKLILK